ncbi:hypothetical protein [Polaromonas sp. LjRoot131]|uniref:hypothetical protein n=1 Tax=Polaromonas sp. LjRoot131 TaxID=3342262 RepID=UPI003ED07DA9
MAYNNVRFIGYVIDTAPESNPDGSKIYLGLNNPALDIEARCELMLRAMQVAKDALPPQSPPVPDGDTLNVFMAPEFFFRGVNGAYGMDDVQLVIATLQGMAAKPGWTDWLFTFGTILGVSSPTFKTAPYDIDPLANKEVYNFALVQQGGVASQGDTGAVVVMKELMSGVDFIATAANPGGLLLGEVNHLAPSTTGGPGREQQVLNYDGSGVFSLAGITWGLEVCLDHLGTVRRLQKSPQLPGQDLIQLQLVPSCGMGVQAPSVVTQFGGYVFNCDGSGAARHSTLAEQVPPLRNVVMSSSTPVSNDPIALQGTSPVLEVPVDHLYASGAGVVNIYPARAIPAQQTVPGSTVRLFWQASTDYQFVFLLVYDDNGKYVTMVCEPRSKKTNFYGNNYFLPLSLSLQTQDALKQNVSIQMELRPGSSPYNGAVWCKINVPGFVFQGNAFEFSATTSGPEPMKSW